MNPERIEELLRQQPPDELPYGRPVPALADMVVHSRPALGRSTLAASGMSALLVVALLLVVAGSRLGQAPSSSGTPTGSLGSSSPSATGATGVIPWIDSRYATPSAEPTQPPADLALCPKDQLVLLAGGWGGATGSAAGGVTLINLWANPCRLGAPTSVVLRDASGATIATDPSPPAQSVVGIAPGGTAVGILVWDNWCRPAAPAGPLRVALTMTLGADAGTTQATLESEVNDLQTGSPTPRCDTPSAPSTVGVVGPSSSDRQLGDYGRQACQPSDLRAFAGGWGAAAGTWYSHVVVYNASSFDCDLPAQPSVEVRDADKRVVLSQAGLAGSGSALPAGATVTVELALSDWCTAPPKQPLSLDLRLGTHTLAIEPRSGPDGAPPVPPCMAASAIQPPAFDVGPFVVPGGLVDEAPVDPGDTLAKYLGVAVSLPPSVQPGDVLDYTVTLTNHDPYDKPYNLAVMCPSYTERLILPGSTSVAERYLLNCDPAGVVAGGASRTFEMRLVVPADAPTGLAAVVWQLGQTGAGVKVTLSIGSDVIAPSVPPTTSSTSPAGST